MMIHEYKEIADDHLMIFNFLNVPSTKKAIRLIASFAFTVVTLKFSLFFLAPVTQRSILTVLYLWELKAFRIESVQSLHSIHFEFLVLFFILLQNEYQFIIFVNLAVEKRR